MTLGRPFSDLGFNHASCIAICKDAWQKQLPNTPPVRATLRAGSLVPFGGRKPKQEEMEVMRGIAK